MAGSGKSQGAFVAGVKSGSGGEHGVKSEGQPVVITTANAPNALPNTTHYFCAL